MSEAVHFSLQYISSCADIDETIFSWYGGKNVKSPTWPQTRRTWAFPSATWMAALTTLTILTCTFGWPAFPSWRLSIAHFASNLKTIPLICLITSQYVNNTFLGSFRASFRCWNLPSLIVVYGSEIHHTGGRIWQSVRVSLWWNAELSWSVC